MPAQPPKVSVWNNSLVTESPDVFSVNPTVPSAWGHEPAPFLLRWRNTRGIDGLRRDDPLPALVARPSEWALLDAVTA